MSAVELGSTSPKLTADTEQPCRDCGTMFTTPPQVVESMLARGMQPPKRCRACRREYRHYAYGAWTVRARTPIEAVHRLRHLMYRDRGLVIEPMPELHDDFEPIEITRAQADAW